MMRKAYDSDDSELAVAMAASAYAIHSLEEGDSRIQMKKTNTGKQESFKPSQAGPVRKPSMRDTRPLSFMRPSRASSTEGQRSKEASRGNARGSDAKADAWEKDQMLKIQKRYDNIYSRIEAWENEKRVEAKRKLDKRKSEIELKKSRNLKHYYNKIGRIGNIAGGARAQAEEKREHDENIVKEKARRMRSTGTARVKYCFCF